ncbi:MAG: ATP-grasp domain-containing protein [Muribaculaceae bacterium]|nr:ATP-grasp domain-containing protein [Muribaculaceae bacterium]
MIPHQPKHLNFLFLGGAKRVAMARLIKKACNSRGLECNITGYELSTHSALSAEGDIIAGLRWDDERIYADLDNICRERNIDIILPFVDRAVTVAVDFVANHSTSGVFAPVSPRVDAEKMFDKCAAAVLFENNKLPIPKTFQGSFFSYPLIAKPRFGSASKGIIEIDNQQQLDEVLNDRSNYLIQERFDHRQEITVDCYVGIFDGSIALTSPRIRLEVNGGEVVRTITIDEEKIISLTKDALRATGLRGAITVQLIRDLDSGHLMIMEINPRLGGGAVASVNAGADLLGLIIDDALGLPLKQQRATAGVETVRYLADVIFYPEK